MNGKMARMLRKMKRSDHRSKRLLRSLTPTLRGLVRKQHKADRTIDTLGQITSDYSTTQTHYAQHSH